MRVVPISFYGCGKLRATLALLHFPRRKQSWWMPPFPPLLFTAPHRNNFRQLSVPTNTSAGMLSSDSRDVQFESKTWGQTSCFISQAWPGRQTHYTQYATPSRHWDEAFTLGFTAGAGNLACSAPMAHCSTLKVHSAILAVSQIINSTHQRFAFHAYYFEHRPNNILRPRDATVSWAHLCMREGKRSQQIKSVPWLLTWLV